MTTNHRELASVIELSTLQRRYRLEDLLERRYAAAVIAIERLSHSKPDTDDAYDLLLAIEDQISKEFPEAFAEAWPRWVTNDATWLHGTGVLVTGCSICHDIAAASGVNLEQPEHEYPMAA